MPVKGKKNDAAELVKLFWDVDMGLEGIRSAFSVLYDEILQRGVRKDWIAEHEKNLKEIYEKQQLRFDIQNDTVL